jgi:hypothetical protein
MIFFLLTFVQTFFMANSCVVEITTAELNPSTADTVIFLYKFMEA